MTKSGRKKCLSFSPFRRRRQAATDRRFCIIWINSMVKKQVEKHMAEVHSELHLMHHALREEMVAEIREQLRELVTRLNREKRVTSKWQRIKEKDNKEKTEDEKDEANSLNLETMSLNVSKTSSDIANVFILRKPPKWEQMPRESLMILMDVSSKGDTGANASNDADTSSQPDEREPEQSQQISSGVATVPDTSQLIKESDEKESSRNPFTVNSSFMPQEQRCEETHAIVNGTKEEETLLTERQWQEWMEKQEMRENLNIKPVNHQNTKKQGGAGAAPPLPQKDVMLQNMKEVDTMKRIKTYFSDLFNPHTPYKWKRFEDED
ncbi:uncharacterized protein LOC117944311 isoform X2 [Etheostoma cragini]|uniref:uncharacterized protein LOC117944311 isoform X2 n=1 Tax=Etheostoma cragini TaxID=417921 RepID=UPI00155E98CB|nr:uncharacterized protein LOC117944311 isoform X2 [Etheostoma cragini]